MIKVTAIANSIQVLSFAAIGALGCTHSPTQDPLATSTTPRGIVIFLPGILGSQLYDQAGTKRWPPGFLQAFSFADALACNSDGSSQHPVSAGDPLEEYYGKMELKLTQSGYKVYRFGYDWRLDNAINADRLAAFIDATKADKVNLIAHSMGGLVSLSYLKRFGPKRVDRFITIGTPWLGTPGTLKTLETGDTVPGVLGHFIHGNFTRLYRNNASWYQLLPNQSFFDLVEPSYIQVSTAGKPAAPVTGFDATRAFILTRPWANRILMARATDFVAENELITTLKGVDSYFIIGYGFPTTRQLTFYQQEDGRTKVDIAWDRNGDDAVRVKSANIGGKSESIHPGHTYYIEEEHARLPGNPDVIRQILGILDGMSPKAEDKMSPKAEDKMSPKAEN